MRIGYHQSNWSYSYSIAITSAGLFKPYGLCAITKHVGTPGTGCMHFNPAHNIAKFQMKKLAFNFSLAFLLTIQDILFQEYVQFTKGKTKVL